MQDGPPQQSRDPEWASAVDRAIDPLRRLYDHDPTTLELTVE